MRHKVEIYQHLGGQPITNAVLVIDGRLVHNGQRRFSFKVYLTKLMYFFKYLLGKKYI